MIPIQLNGEHGGGFINGEPVQPGRAITGPYGPGPLQLDPLHILQDLCTSAVRDYRSYVEMRQYDTDLRRQMEQTRQSFRNKISQGINHTHIMNHHVDLVSLCIQQAYMVLFNAGPQRQ